MKASTSGLRTLLHGSTDAAFSDLVTVTLADATVARWTTDAYDLDYGGNTYTAGGSGTAPTIQRGRIRETTGLDVATMDLVLGCGPAGGATIGGVDLRQLAVTGRLDDARVAVQRAYMATPGGAVVGVVDRFQGVITDCEADSYEVRARVQSDLYRLTEVLPRHLIREKCSWALGDAGCGIDLPALEQTAIVLSVAGARTSLSATFGTSPATGYFNGGSIRFADGALAGLKYQIKSYTKTSASNGTIVPEVPFGLGALGGDGIYVLPGCDKTIATCDGTFSNLPRRRGFDFVPPPDSVTR